MTDSLAGCVRRWLAWGGFDPRLWPDTRALESAFSTEAAPCRAGASAQAIRGWEERYGYRFPAGLRAWLSLSDGLYKSGPLVHPISAIGPMVPFARVPGMMVQPESWIELGNPNMQTICIDLAYHMPGGGCPIFTSGDDREHSPPRIIASSFEQWFLELVRQGGREYWFDRDFVALGDPWQLHRRHVAHPPLRSRLQHCADRVARLWHQGVDELEIASSLGLSRCDVELIFRHVQHQLGDLAPP